MGRTLVIGDIHGGYKGLVQCLERSNFDKENDTLISLGDIADGWSQVPECVEELLSIKNLIAIKGNHDVWAYEWLKYGNAQRMWLSQGGKATFDAYVDRQALIDEHVVRFFDKQINYYVDDQNRAFVHGGFVSKQGLGHEPHQANYYWDRDMWSLALMQDRNELDQELIDNPTHATRFYKHKEIFIGHTTTMTWDAKGNMKESKDPNQVLNGRITVPMNRCNVWNLDTGGGYFGKITIMDIDTKEYWQSDPMRELYPDEKGR